MNLLFNFILSVMRDIISGLVVTGILAALNKLLKHKNDRHSPK